jgi:hypothetical protein
MVVVYALVLVVGMVALVGWIFTRALASNLDRPRLDPESRFGTSGRRVVAGLVGFGMGGLSSEFSPRGIAWPLALVLALVGGAALAWYAGRVDVGVEAEPT